MGRSSPPGEWADRPFARRARNRLRRLLGIETDLAFDPTDGGRLWVGFAAGAEKYWAVVPRVGRDIPDSGTWMVWLGLLLLAAMAAGYLIVAHVSRPIKALAQAAEKIAEGDDAQPVPESGPSETRDLVRSFNRMAESLRRVESDRALLLAGVSHDLRTPLARLRLGLELLAGSDGKLKTEMERDLLLMDEILGQFLAYVRTYSNEAAQPACE